MILSCCVNRNVIVPAAFSVWLFLAALSPGQDLKSVLVKGKAPVVLSLRNAMTAALSPDGVAPVSNWETEEVPLPPPPDANVKNPWARTLQELDKSDRIHRKRIEQITELLDELKILVDNASVRESKPESKSPVVTIADPKTNSSDNENGPVDETLGALTPEEQSRKATFMSAAEVTGKAVDRLRLADSLFTIGEIRLALSIYEELLSSQSTDSDREWIVYQTASCYRRLQAYTKSERLYRTVLGFQSNSLWSINARWWLRTLEWKRQLATQQENLQLALQEQKTVEINDDGATGQN